jgi:HEAT repeat protein
METILDELFSGEDERAETVIAQLSTLTPEQARVLQTELSGKLSASNPEQRWWAARALAALTGPGISSLLCSALGDPEAEVRQCAALGLRSHPDEACLPALTAALSDPDPLVARLAADALEAVGKPATPALIEALQHGPHPVKLHAIRALAAIKDTRSIPALFEALNTDSALMEYWASLGLDNMGVGTSFFLPE